MSGSVLRSDLEVALSEVYRAARHTAATCRRSAERATGDLRVELDQLATLGDQAAARSRRELEGAGELPSEPDPDRDDLENLVRAARTALSPHPEEVLIRAAVGAAGELADASRQARAVGGLPPAAAAWLDQLERELASACERLRHRAA